MAAFSLDAYYRNGCSSSASGHGQQNHSVVLPSVAESLHTQRQLKGRKVKKWNKNRVGMLSASMLAAEGHIQHRTMVFPSLAKGTRQELSPLFSFQKYTPSCFASSSLVLKHHRAQKAFNAIFCLNHQFLSSAFLP